MAKKIISPPTNNVIDPDNKNGDAAARQGDRRHKEPLDIKFDFNADDSTIEVQVMDKKQPDILSEDERRQANRRNSTPKLLSDDERVILRKK